MRNHGWLALGVLVLAVGPGSAPAQEPASQVPQLRPVLTMPPPPPMAAPVPEVPCAPCSACAGHSGKWRRIWEWLTYCPKNKGYGKACKGCCEGCPPPLYVFFPCKNGCAAGGCAACGAGPAAATLYYAKEAGEPASSPVAQVSHTQDVGSADAATPPTSGAYHPTTYKPNGIAPVMPLLEPSQFRRPPVPNAPGSCPTGWQQR
jgi:hypothetical protein